MVGANKTTELCAYYHIFHPPPRTSSNSTKTCARPAGEHENELKNLTLVNILIIVVLLLILLANAREGQSGRL